MPHSVHPLLLHPLLDAASTLLGRRQEGGLHVLERCRVRAAAYQTTGASTPPRPAATASQTLISLQGQNVQGNEDDQLMSTRTQSGGAQCSSQCGSVLAIAFVSYDNWCIQKAGVNAEQLWGLPGLLNIKAVESYGGLPWPRLHSMGGGDKEVSCEPAAASTGSGLQAVLTPPAPLSLLR
ncbi:unnamed protein product [Boreogadus saida]